MMNIQGQINRAVGVAGLIGSNLKTRQEQIKAANEVAAARRDAAIQQQKEAAARIEARKAEEEKKRKEGQAELYRLLTGKELGV